MELATCSRVQCAFRKSPTSFTLLLACRVGRHNLITQDEFLGTYGFGGGEGEEDELDDQGFEYFDDLRRLMTWMMSWMMRWTSLRPSGPTAGWSTMLRMPSGRP